MFGFGKKSLAAEMAGHNLTALVMDADSCWADVCELRSYKVSGPVAICEMAFARAGLARAIMLEKQSPPIAARILKAARECVVETFSDQDNDETWAFYRGPMAKKGLAIVDLYAEKAFWTAEIASFLGSRLGVPGVWVSEISPMFERQNKRIRDVLTKARLI